MSGLSSQATVSFFNIYIYIYIYVFGHSSLERYWKTANVTGAVLATRQSGIFRGFETRRATEGNWTSYWWLVAVRTTSQTMWNANWLNESDQPSEHIPPRSWEKRKRKKPSEPWNRKGEEDEWFLELYEGIVFLFNIKRLAGPRKRKTRSRDSTGGK